MEATICTSVKYLPFSPNRSTKQPLHAYWGCTFDDIVIVELCAIFIPLNTSLTFENEFFDAVIDTCTFVESKMTYAHELSY